MKTGNKRGRQRQRDQHRVNEGRKWKKPTLCYVLSRLGNCYLPDERPLSSAQRAEQDPPSAASPSGPPLRKGRCGKGSRMGEARRLEDARRSARAPYISDATRNLPDSFPTPHHDRGFGGLVVPTRALARCCFLYESSRVAILHRLSPSSTLRVIHSVWLLLLVGAVIPISVLVLRRGG